MLIKITSDSERYAFDAQHAAALRSCGLPSQVIDKVVDLRLHTTEGLCLMVNRLEIIAAEMSPCGYYLGLQLSGRQLQQGLGFLEMIICQVGKKSHTALATSSNSEGNPYSLDLPVEIIFRDHMKDGW